MKRERLEAEAKIIAEKLRDVNGLGFYCKALLVLGIPTCHELCSISLDMERRGKLRTSVGAYFNGCVMREIESRGLKWNT